MNLLGAPHSKADAGGPSKATTTLFSNFLALPEDASPKIPLRQLFQSIQADMSMNKVESANDQKLLSLSRLQAMLPGKRRLHQDEHLTRILDVLGKERAMTSLAQKNPEIFGEKMALVRMELRRFLTEHSIGIFSKLNPSVIDYLLGVDPAMTNRTADEAALAEVAAAQIIKKSQPLETYLKYFVPFKDIALETRAIVLIEKILEYKLPDGVSFIRRFAEAAVTPFLVIHVANMVVRVIFNEPIDVLIASATILPAAVVSGLIWFMIRKSPREWIYLQQSTALQYANEFKSEKSRTAAVSCRLLFGAQQW